MKAKAIMDALKTNPDLKALNADVYLEQESKYRNQATVYNLIRYASKREAEYAQSCDLRQSAGELKWWTRQIPLYLPSGIKLVVDFGLCYKDGTFHLVEIKGVETPVWKLKMKLLTNCYPNLEIEVLK